MRYSPGVYQLVNRDDPTGNTWEVIVDNQPMVVQDETTITIEVFDILTAVPDNAYHTVTRLSNVSKNIRGNVTKWRG